MNFKKVLLSLIILICISTSIAFCFASNLITFSKWFIGVTVVQFLIHYIVSYILDVKWGEKIRQLEYNAIQEITKTKVVTEMGEKP